MLILFTFRLSSRYFLITEKLRVKWSVIALARKDEVLTGIEQDFCVQIYPSELCELPEVFLVMPTCLKSTTTHHKVVIQLSSVSGMPRGVVSKFFDRLSIFPIFSVTLTRQENYNLVVLDNACKKRCAELYLVRRHEKLSSCQEKQDASWHLLE